MNNTMPTVGFGTWKFKNSAETTEIILNAVSSGYRLLDTAAAYGNEEAIGDALAQSSRSDLIISGKLWNAERGNVSAACDETIRKLQCAYLDIYLMHWPASKAVHDDWAEINSSVWAQMEKLISDGKVKNIGVSNFKINQLEGLIKNCSIKPFVNQIEFHPGFMQREIVDYCKAQGIAVQAWSPLRSGRSLKQQPVIDMAQKYAKTPAQIILKWCIQNGITPIVKSSDKERMASNLCLDFIIEEDDMTYLNSLPYTGSSGLDSETLTLFG